MCKINGAVLAILLPGWTDGSPPLKKNKKKPTFITPSFMKGIYQCIRIKINLFARIHCVSQMSELSKKVIHDLQM